MVLPPLMTIITAASVAILSSMVVLVWQQLHHTNKGMLSGNGGSIPATMSSSPQDELVLFTLDPNERSSLLLQDDNETAFNKSSKKLLDVRRVFDQEGYVIIRGLLDANTLRSLDEASDVVLEQKLRNGASSPSTFSALSFGPVYWAAPVPLPQEETNEANGKESKNGDQDRALSAFRNVSLHSAIPSFVAQVLLDLAGDKSTLRILKDVFLAKGKEADYCGWHVDDEGFWPIQYNASTSSKPGVNVWIAMDDMSASRGGGLAVAPKSHSKDNDWRWDAYRAIGSTPTYPDEGYESPQARMQNYKTSTCNLANVEPELAANMDESMHVFDFKRGDVLFHTRWLFHRSVPLLATDEEDARNHPESSDTTTTALLRRYSIRYELGDARLLRGFTMEPSVVLQPELAGMTLDEVAKTAIGVVASTSDEESNGKDDGPTASSIVPWYPQCWPHVSDTEMEHLYEIVQRQLPAFEPMKQELIQQLRPYFRKKD